MILGCNLWVAGLDAPLCDDQAHHRLSTSEELEVRYSTM